MYLCCKMDKAREEMFLNKMHYHTMISGISISTSHYLFVNKKRFYSLFSFS